MLLALTATDIALAFLGSMGVKAEVLGFTTRSWRGGRSRLLWRLLGSPKRPGRLNDLLHIVYCDAVKPGPGARSAGGDRRLAPMLRQEVLKENVDGEALEWAAGRLAGRPETRRVLLMISDGAPVDDSTLDANGLDYLHDHLQAVVAEVAGAMTVGQLQLQESWDSVFPLSAMAATPNEVTMGVVELLERALLTAHEA